MCECKKGDGVWGWDGGWVGVVGIAENMATQPRLDGAWAELGKN